MTDSAEEGMTPATANLTALTATAITEAPAASRIATRSFEDMTSVSASTLANVQW